MDINKDRDIDVLGNDTMMEMPAETYHTPPPQELNDHTKEHFKKAAKRKRCISRLKIVWAFLSFLLSVADVTVIIYLSYLHFHHSQDMMAWLMLLPIVLNFIGIFTFLSK